MGKTIMKRTIYLLGILAVAFVLLFAFNSSASAATTPTPVYVEGTLSGNVNWTNDHVYIVTGDIQVANGATLTIFSGTSVLFENGTALRVNGTLIADATGGNAITFSANSSTLVGAWEGITVNSTGVATMKNVVVSYADVSLYVNDGVISLQDVTVNNTRTGIYIYESGAATTLAFTDVTVENYYTYGIHVRNLDRALTFSLSDSEFVGADGSEGILIEALDDVNGTIVSTFEDVDVTGGDAAVDVYGEVDVTCAVVDCNFMNQNDVSLNVESVNGTVALNVKNSVIDGSDATTAYWLYTFGEKDYSFEVIPRDFTSTNQTTNTGATLVADLPFTFHFAGNDVDQISMNRNNINFEGYGYLNPAASSNLLVGNAMTFFGYEVYSDRAVFQWYQYDGSNNYLLDLYEVIVYANGDIAVNYNVMESNGVGTFVMSAGGYTYDMVGVLGNPYDLDYTSYLIKGDSLSLATGIYAASLFGDVDVNISDSKISNLDGGAVYATTEVGYVIYEMTNSTISWINNEFWYGSAVNLGTYEGVMDVIIEGNTFDRIYGSVFDIGSVIYEADDEFVDIIDNHFSNCVMLGWVYTDIYMDEADDLGVNQTMSINREFSGNDLVDCGCLEFWTDAELSDNSTLDLAVNEVFSNNTYVADMFVSDTPLHNWVGYHQYALFESDVYYYNYDPSIGNEVFAYNVEVVGNVVDMPTIATGSMYVPGFVDLYVYEEFSGENLASDITANIADNEVTLDPFFLASSFTRLVSIYTDYDLYEGSEDISETIMVTDNSFTSERMVTSGISIYSEVSSNDNLDSEIDCSIIGVYSIDDNNFEGLYTAAYIGLDRDAYNCFGDISINDAVTFNSNEVVGCGQAADVQLENDFDYDGLFALATIYKGEIVPLNVEYTSSIEMLDNTAEIVYDEGSVFNVDLSNDVDNPGLTMFTQPNFVGTTTVDIADNEITIADDDVTAIEVRGTFGASGHSAVSMMTMDVTIAGNTIGQAEDFYASYERGIYVYVRNTAEADSARDMTGDNAASNLIATVEISGNKVTGADVGIYVRDRARARYANVVESTTLNALVTGNTVINSTEYAIRVRLNTEVYASSGTMGVPDGIYPTAMNNRTIDITNNVIDGTITAHGVYAQTEYNLSYYDPPGIDYDWAYMNGTSVFTIEGNKISNANCGVNVNVYDQSHVETSVHINENTISNSMYGIYAVSASGEISDNVISSTASDGIYGSEVYDMMIAGNTITEAGTLGMGGYGIDLSYPYNVTVSDNVITNSYSGLYIDDGYMCDIIGNTVDMNDGIGAYFYDCEDIIVEDNSFSQNGGYGVEFYNGWDFVFGNNTVNNNLGYGLYLDLEDSRGYLYNNEFSYNERSGLYVEADLSSPAPTWYGVKWIIDDEASVKMNTVYFDGEIVIAKGGVLNIESVESFYFEGSLVDGTPSLLVNGTMNAINTEFGADDIFEFEVNGIVDAEYCGFSDVYTVCIHEGSEAEFRACTFDAGEVATITINNASPVFSMCTMIGQFQDGDASYPVVSIEGAKADPTITGGIIIGGWQGIFAKDTGLGNVYDTIFILNEMAGIYGDNVSGKIHDNVFMLNGISILLENSDVSIEDNEIGWTNYIDALAGYAPLIQAIAHHVYAALSDVMDMIEVDMNATEFQDLLDDITGMSTKTYYGDILSTIQMATTGVYAKNCELVMSGNTYGMLYQCVYVVGGTLSFSDKIETRNLEIPYYLGLNTSSLKVPIQNVNGLYAAKAIVTIDGAEISVVDDAIMLESCNATISNSVLDAGDFDLFAMNGCEVTVVNTVLDKVKSEDSNSIDMYCQLEVTAVDDEGNAVSGRTVTIYDANGVKVAEGKTDSNGKFTASVLAYTITDSGNGAAQVYTVKVDFKNGDVSVDATASDLAASVLVTAEKDNTAMYISLGIVVLAVLLIAALLLMRGKKQ